MCGRIASGGVHLRGRAAAVVVVTRFTGLGRGVARFRAGAGAGVGAGSPWMHWDFGRSHSSQYSSAIGATLTVQHLQPSGVRRLQPPSARRAVDMRQSAGLLGSRPEQQLMTEDIL
jgi:hypothetical protein